MSEDPNLILDQIGIRILKRRQALGLSQDELAERMGITRPNIGRIERGQQNVTVRTMCRLAEALETTLHDLMFGGPAGK